MSRRRLQGIGDSGSVTPSSMTSSSYASSIRRNTPIIRLDEAYLQNAHLDESNMQSARQEETYQRSARHEESNMRGARPYESYQRAVENNNENNNQQQEVKAEGTHHTHYTHGGEFSDQEFEEPSSRLLGVHGLRIPVSSTRSGKKYGKKWAPGSKEALAAQRRRSSRGRRLQEEELTDTDEETGSEYSTGLNDVVSFRKFEKKLEYSGHESLVKETRLNHLYGLDNSDVEFSDQEQTEYVDDDRLQAPRARHIVHRAHSKSTLSTISTFIYSILTSILTSISSFVRASSQTVSSLAAAAGTYVKHGVGSVVSDGAQIVVYPFHLLYSFILALLGYIWRALRWICYDVWVGTDKGKQSFMSAVSGSGSTITTTTTTTVTETIIEEEDESDDEIDSKPQFGIKTRRKGASGEKSTGIASRRNDSWIVRTLKTMIVTTTYVMLLPVTAAKGAVSGVASTASWLAGTDPEQTERARVARAESALYEDTTSSTSVQQESSSSGVKRRRSRSTAHLQESETSGGGAVAVREESFVTRCMKTTVSTVTTILWLPADLCMGLGRVVSRGIYGIGHQASNLTGLSRDHDEDKDTDTTFAYETRSAKVKIHSVSGSRKSRLVAILERVWDVLWWPIGLLLALCRWVWGGLRTLSYWFVAHETRSSKVKIHSVSGSRKSRLVAILERVRDALWWPIGLLLALCRWFWGGLRSLSYWFVGQAVPGAVVGSANKLQRGLAKSVITDTWILSRTGYLRRTYGCFCCLIPLLLIPLLLTCAYYLYDRGLYQSPLVPVIVPLPAPVPVLPKDPSPPVAAGAIYTDEDLAARVQIILIGLLKEREVHTHTILTADWQAWAAKFAAGQTTELSDHKKDVDVRIAALVTERVDQLAVGMGTQSEEDAARQMAALAGQRDRMTSLEGQLAAIIGLSDGLKEQIATAKIDMRSQDDQVRQSGAEAVANLEGKLDALAVELRNLQSSHGALAAAFKDCCKNDSSLALLIRKGVEEHLAAMLGGAGGGGGLPMGGGPGGSSRTTFLSWLHSQFVGQDDMDSRLAALLAKIEDDIKATSSEAHNAATLAAAAVAAAAASKVTESSTTKQETTVIGGVATGGVTEEHVRILIQNALMLYSADKTGKVDYALESAGGSVVSTRCSETYHRRTAQLSLFGIPLWYTSNSPRTVIQPDMQPGQCWAFRGDTGFLVIQLAGLVRPTAFTLEHIPKTLSPSGKIDSAPAEFSVLGLQHDRDMDGVFLGNYTYSAKGEPLQTFIVTESNSIFFPIVELRILGNHGNKEYTCLYRFRVHGVSTV